MKKGESEVKAASKQIQKVAGTMGDYFIRKTKRIWNKKKEESRVTVKL